MSPEYAMEGLFSIKSDVYSFGVLLLEIITGRRNSTYYHDSPSFNLVGCVSKFNLCCSIFPYFIHSYKLPNSEEFFFFLGLEPMERRQSLGYSRSITRKVKSCK